MRINRITKKLAVVVFGLALGWYVAGIAPTAGVSLADDTQSHPKPHHPPHDLPHHGALQGGHGQPPTHAAADPHHDDHHDPALAAAQLLVPQRGDVGWYRPMLAIAVGLFVAAVVLGIPALKAQRPDPAADHDAGHH